MKINEIKIGNTLPFVLIAGPCVIENLDHTLFHAEKIKQICSDLNIPLIYKSSFDKANRTSLSSNRGVGIDEGLEILSKVKQEFGLTLLTDVHEVSHCKKVGSVVDVLQIPAFLCRQTDLLISAAKTNCVINIKHVLTATKGTIKIQMLMDFTLLISFIEDLSYFFLFFFLALLFLEPIFLLPLCFFGYPIITSFYNFIDLFVGYSIVLNTYQFYYERIF